MAVLAGVSVVVPVYNSEASLGELVARLREVLAGVRGGYEVILVDDSSTDGSWEVVAELARAHPEVRGVRLRRNYGQHNATLCGTRLATHELTVTLDDDLQNPPEEVPHLLRALTPDLDVVYGVPAAARHGFRRRLAARVTKMVLKSSLGVANAPDVSSFRVFRTALREAFSDYRSPLVSIDVLLPWATTRFGSVTVRHEERRLGRSNYTFGQLVTHAVNMVTGFSTLPLRLASLTGFAFTAFGIAVLVFVVARFFINGGSVPGFPFLASTIAIFAGAQLFALGIIGEYLARVHLRTMDRPAYVVGATTWAAGDEHGA